MTDFLANPQLFDGTALAVTTSHNLIFNSSVKSIKLDYRTDALTAAEMTITCTGKFTFTTPINGLDRPFSQIVITPVNGNQRIITLTFAEPIQVLSVEATSNTTDKKLYLSVLEMRSE